MNPVYEYIAAISIITLVVGFSLYQLNSMSSYQLTVAHEEQLQPVAVRLLDKILLTKGYPEDWGSDIYINESNLVDFGLSSQLGGMYQVSVDNLMRLVNITGNLVNPLYIPPTTMGNLTGIYDNNSWSYGFRLLVKNSLNISITDGPISEKYNTPTNFTVDVTNYLGRSMSNAEVDAFYFVVYVYNPTGGGKEDEVFDYSGVRAMNITNWQGKTILHFEGKMPEVPTGIKNLVAQVYCLFITVNYYGLQSQQIEPLGGDTTVSLLIQGQYLIANFQNISGIPNGASHLKITAIELTSSQQLILNPADNETNGESGKLINKGNKNLQVYHLENPLSDDVIAAGLIIRRGQKYTIVFASRPLIPVALDYRSHSYAYAGINSDTVSRLIKIGRNSYYAELTLWRMVE